MSSPLRLGAGLLAGVGFLIAAGLFQGPRVRFEKADPAFMRKDGILFYGSRPFTGTQVQRFETGDIYKESRFENGRQEGPMQEYSVQGVLRATWNFHDGKKDGRQEGWFIEGPKRFEYNYKAGLLDGEQTEWHVTGQLFRRQVFERGEEVAKKIFFANADIYTNYVKREGRTYGIDGGALCFDPKKDGEK